MNFHEFLHEVLLHALKDTVTVLPFLFLTYLFLEYVEHKASGKINSFMQKSGTLGPLVGGALGAVPQCGFSAVVANLYCTKIVTLGALISVFLSTSDEMLILMVSARLSAKTIIGILLYKVLVGILVGFAIDLVIRLMKKPKAEINIDELCENDGCRCEGGIFRSSIHHTVSTYLFILICTLAINTVIFFVGDEPIRELLHGKAVISHLLAAVFGLIPNCAASVILTEFYTGGFITLGTMLSGLFSGSGVGLLVLFKVNKNIKQNLIIVGILILCGFSFGLLADAVGLGELLV